MLRLHSIGVRHGSEVESADPVEVIRVDRVEKKPVCDSSGSNHGILGPSLNLTARAPK